MCLSVLRAGPRPPAALPAVTQYPGAVTAKIDGQQPFLPSDSGKSHELSLKPIFSAKRSLPTGAAVRLALEPLGKKLFLLDTAARGLLLKSANLEEKDLIRVPGWAGPGPGIQTGLFRIFRSLSAESFSMAPAVAEIFADRGFPWVDGILSTEVFEPWIVRLDFRKSRLILRPRDEISRSEGVEWPSVLDRNWWIVSVQVGKRPAQMLLDSGAAESYLTEEWFAENLPNALRQKSGAVPSTSGLFEGGMWEIEVPGARPQPAALLGQPIGGKPLISNRRVDGVLGYDILHRLIFDLDYRSAKIRVLP